MSIYVNDNGSLRKCFNASQNNNGTLRHSNEGFVNDNGTLRRILGNDHDLGAININSQDHGYKAFGGFLGNPLGTIDTGEYGEKQIYQMRSVGSSSTSWHFGFYGNHANSGWTTLSLTGAWNDGTNTKSRTRAQMTYATLNDPTYGWLTYWSATGLPNSYWMSQSTYRLNVR